MAFLKRTSEIEKAEHEVAKLYKQRERLIEEESKQRGALDAAVAARRKSLRGDETFDAKATEAARNADMALAAVRDALADVDTDIGAAQQAVAAAHDQSRRKIEADARTADLAAAQTAFAEFLSSTEKVVTSFGKLAGPFCESGNVAGFAANAAAELKLAGAAVFSDVKSYIANVSAGHMQIYGYTPPAPPPSRPKPIPMKAVYLLENVKFLDPSGVVKTVGKNMADTLPVPLAELAIAQGLADAPDSHRAKNLIALHGGNFHIVHESDCFDLDTGARPEPRPSKGVRYAGPLDGPMTLPDTLPNFIAQPPRPAVTGTISARRLPEDSKK
jgi:hypothetical protein